MIQWTSMTELQILIFALVLLRMTAFVVSSAIFGAPSVSVHVKILLSVTLSIVLFPTIKTSGIAYSLVSEEIIGLAVRELIVGLFLGFLTRLFFFTLSIAGDLIAITVGLSSAQLYNPLMGSQGNTLDTFFTTLGTLIFLVINGHHILLSGIAQSFDLIPVAAMTLKVTPFAEVAVYTQNLFVMAIKMCAPVLATVFLANIAMGILGRAVPQINVLVTSMPVTIMLGMAVVFLCLPLMISEMNGLAEMTAGKLFEVMKQL